MRAIKNQSKVGGKTRADWLSDKVELLRNQRDHQEELDGTRFQSRRFQAQREIRIIDLQLAVVESALSMTTQANAAADHRWNIPEGD